eukprot:SAG31_NODE_8_length_42345_cov_10.980992_11_plen_138_part_00
MSEVIASHSCNYVSQVGQGLSRNVGVARARGEIVFFLDADDVYHEDHLRYGYRAMKNSTVGLARSKLRLADGQGAGKTASAPSKAAGWAEAGTNGAWHCTATFCHEYLRSCVDIRGRSQVFSQSGLTPWKMVPQQTL